MNELIISYLANYGYMTLFCFFLIELVGAPLPGETIMFYIGYLVYIGQMSWGLSILAVWAGTVTGATVAYWLGLKVGSPLLHKYGRYFGLTPEKFDKTEQWIAVYGKKIIIIAYFVPGVRHITPYAAGILEIPFHIFAANAYFGAFLYAATFITLGKVFGPEDEMVFDVLGKNITAVAVALLIALVIYLYRKYKASSG